MKKEEILQEIAEMQSLINSPSVPEDEKGFAREEIAELEAKLAEMEIGEMVLTISNQKFEVKKVADFLSRMDNGNDDNGKYENIIKSSSEKKDWIEKNFKIVRGDFDVNLDEAFKIIDEPAEKKTRTGLAAKFKAAASKRGRKPKAAPAEKSPRKPKAAHPVLKPGDTTKNGVKILDEQGRHLDANGEIIAVGDQVQVSNKNGSFIGHIINLAQKRGGGHQVKYQNAKGQNRTEMFQPSVVVKVGSAGEDLDVVHYMEKLPEKVVDKAIVAGRQDCDENQIVLVKPEEKTVVAAPMVADPEKGDMIAVNKQGHPMYVVEGEAVKNDYEKVAKADLHVKKGKVEKVTNADEDDDQARKHEAAEPADEKIKAVKPTADCSFLKGEEEPALQTFVEGMRQAWRQDKTSDKILRVLLRKSDKKVILHIKKYFLLDTIPVEKYYSVCLSTGKLTATKAPVKGEYQTIMGREQMVDLYRSPNNNTCRRVSKELHVTCYREGNCSDDRKKKLIELFTHNCRKREDQLSRAYRKWAHEQTAKRWKGYEGDKSYAQIYREVIDNLKKGK